METKNSGKEGANSDTFPPKMAIGAMKDQY
jgi:hypothetical protein